MNDRQAKVDECVRIILSTRATHPSERRLVATYVEEAFRICEDLELPVSCAPRILESLPLGELDSLALHEREARARNLVEKWAKEFFQE